jgi:hypothetical protein
VSDRNNPQHTESDWQFFRWPGRLRPAETKAKCNCDQGNPATGADELLALVKKRNSLPFVVEGCEMLAQVVKDLWLSVDPNECESSYERQIERLAFRVVLALHSIPLEEVEEAKNLIDARVTETLT